MTQPRRLVAAFGKRLERTELLGERREDVEIVARFAHRIDGLFHLDEESIARARTDVVALE